MDGTFCTPVVAADAVAVAEVVVALESLLYGQSGFSRADLEDEWSDLDLERASVARRSRSERFDPQAASRPASALRPRGSREQAVPDDRKEPCVRQSDENDFYAWRAPNRGR